MRTTRASAATIATIAVACAVVWLWPVAPLTLTVDDTFYYLQTARHVAAGHGPTFDGVQATNGFHPLWMAVLVPIARILGNHPDTFVRFVLTCQVLLFALGTRTLARAEQRAGAQGRVAAQGLGVVFAVLATNFYFTKIFVNGLESALEYALIAASVHAGVRALSCEDVRRREQWLAATGGLCAAVTLTRLTALVFACLLLAVLWRRVRPRPRAVLEMLAAFALPIALVGAWAYLHFGHVIPVSAAIKTSGPISTSSVVVVTVVFAAASVLAATRIEQRTRGGGVPPPLWLLPLIGYVGIQTASDAILRDVLVPEIWYLVPHATLLALGCSTCLNALAGRRMLRAGIVAAYLAASLLTWVARLNPVSYSTYVAAKTTGQWLSDHTPKAARVAGWDCGIAAFYSDRTFFNLDGLISSWDYKSNYLERGRIREFLDDAEVDFVAQYVEIDPLDVPERDSARMILNGVDLSDWRVVHEERFGFRGAMDTLLPGHWARSGVRSFRWVVVARIRK